MSNPFAFLKKHRVMIIRVISVILFVVAIAALVSVLIPFVLSLENQQSRDEFKEYILSMGLFGLLIFLSLQVVQIVVAIIPGEPIEILAGVLYGPFWGTLSCFLGIVGGTFLIFLLTKLMGRTFISSFYNEEKLARFKFLTNKRKVDFIIFILFFIPGTPKDILTYVAPLTGINIWRFLVISSIARIPSILSSVIIGSSIQKGSFTLSIIIFVSIGVLGALGIFFNKKILDHFHLRHKEENE